MSCFMIPDSTYFLKNKKSDGLARSSSAPLHLMGTITVENPKDNNTFQVNGQRLKPFHELTTS